MTAWCASPFRGYPLGRSQELRDILSVKDTFAYSLTELLLSSVSSRETSLFNLGSGNIKVVTGASVGAGAGVVVGEDLI